jgi:NADPH2:quinone reductase
MRAIVHERTGGPEVLKLVERPEPVAGPGEVVVAVAVSGVNPTDWKTREGNAPGEELRHPQVVPNQDGAGTVIAVGDGVDPARVGQRVWLWEAAWKRADGTAQELVALPARQAVALPDGAGFDLGASLGIPALTAHRCLTTGGAGNLGPGTLAGRTVLVAGGAGAVGHAAIELAVWSDATVVTTVSSPEKAELATAAGAHHVVNYRAGDAAAAIREVAPDGVDMIVEVAPVANAELDRQVVAPNATVAIYARDGDELAVPVFSAMRANTRYQFVLVYTVPAAAKDQAVADVSAAVAAGALRVGRDAGLPLHHFPLADTGRAHAAVADGTVGKVLIDVADVADVVDVVGQREVVDGAGGA